MKRNARPGQQQGAVLVTVALVLLFLLGFMGISLDFGRLFIVKTELQTAMDSCALAAAHELNTEPTATVRATSAGMTAGNLNNVNLQSTTWDGQAKLLASEITFRDAAYNATTVAGSATYVQCQHTQPNIRLWLLQAMGAFSGNTAQYPGVGTVGATAVATRGSAQTTCPIPVVLKPKAGGSAPDYGYVSGEWVTLIMSQNAARGGQIGWANLDGSNNASQTEAELNGTCGTRIGSRLGTPGVQSSVADAWNYRFGIYKNNADLTLSKTRPDFSGYGYTVMNWPNGRNAYSGSPGTGAPASAGNFVAKRTAYASCANTTTTLRTCETITGISLNSFRNVAAPGSGVNGHRDRGTNRRIVTVPVSSGTSVSDFACMLMLQPLSIPLQNVQLEYVGNASAANSPCATNGLPGGSSGPRVPVLVR